MEKQNIQSNDAVKIDSNTYEDNYDVETNLRTYDQINDNPADDHGPHCLYKSVSSQPLNLEVAPAVVNEEQFEVVSLRDDTIVSNSQAICESSMHTSDDRDNKSPILSDLLEMVDPFREHEMKIEHESLYGKLIHYNTDQYPSNNSESGMYMDGGNSPVASPLKPRTKPSMPNVSPELLHLVDSAIMGKPDSLDKLKNVVSGIEIFENVDDETDNIALLVVDSLLATMGGVESFDEDEGSNPPSVMLNSRAAIVAAELIPWLPYIGDSEGIMSPRTRMVRGLLAILRACTRNRSMCSIAGLLGVLLTSAERVFVKENSSMKRWDGTPLCQCICHLAGHSLSPADLRKWFLVISRTLDTVWGTHMMLTLEKAIGGKESKGPACTFEFDGESSGLLGPGESRWPFASGYAFATWIYVESFADTLNAATAAATIAAAAAKSGKSSAMSAAAAASALAGEGTAHMPRLFSFLTSDNQGVEAYFHAQFLVVESGMGKGKKFSLHFTHVFKPQCWYFIGLEHVVKLGLIGKSESELRLYIDGYLYESRQFEFPRISKPLAFCCIGTNPPPTIAGLQRRRRQCPLFAEIGPIYIFKEPIGPENMGCLASRCGDAVPYFGNGAGHPWLSTNDYVRSMTEESIHLDSEISGHIHLIYHPKLLNGRFCPDSSPSGAAGHMRRPAEVLGQVHIAIRMRPVEAMWALAYGGPMCLLPFLVRNINKESLEPEQGGLPLCVAAASLTAPIFRIISVCIQYPANNDEVARICGPEVLSRTLNYFLETLSSLDVGMRGVIGEELVVAVVSLCQSEKINHSLKVQFFINLLLDIKIWSSCDYGLQKKLLSSLADMVFTEVTVMRDANAIQMLLDGCRVCYWSVREPDSTPCFSVTEKSHNIGEVNALVDELFVVIELLVGVASPYLAGDDVACLLRFMADNQQPNQVTRVLSLFYRLVAQPNISRAHKFAKEFISRGGIETLLVFLQRESKIGDFGCQESFGTYTDDLVHCSTPTRNSDFMENGKFEDVNSSGEKESVSKEEGYESSPSAAGDSVSGALHSNSERTVSASESFFLKHFSGKSFSISSDNARNNVYNVDESDGIVVGIIRLIGALISLGYLQVGSHSSPDLEKNFSGLGLYGEGNPMYDDKISLLLFALKNVFQAAPRRLMTMNAYTSLLTASINVSSTGDVLNFYDSGHRFEHFHILNVLLHSLPYAPGSFQCRAIQDLLFLVCSHPENRSSFIKMEAWPEWILEVLISNYETGYNKGCASGSLGDIEDIAHSFLIIMLEHSMRQKDGWKDVEATIHCAEWLSMVGGSSSGGRRARREESLPIFKRRLLGGLLDFSTRELRVQTQVIAAASAGVAAEGLSPKESKVEAENAAQLSVALVENAIVILMLVEDHLRLQSKLSTSSRSKNSTTSLLSLARDSSYFCGNQYTNEAGGLSLDILASMADENGQISTAVMERLTAAAAAEPYESVSCALVSYGSCTNDQAKGWEYRSRLWYGVSHPTKTDVFGGGGSGWESWNSILEKDMNGDWIELPLIKKSVAMLQALLLDESGLGGGLGIGGGSGTGMGGMAALYQLLDSDQPFMCMLRMTLASMREEDNGDDSFSLRNSRVQDGAWNGVVRESISGIPFSAYKSPSALLWSVLSPLLNMPVLEAKRQRVLVASCILYSEVWHAVSIDRKPLRKRYLEAFLPPFVALLRRWRPLLAGIHELATAEGFNPLVVDGRVLAADALPIEASLAMISPEWAAAFASPPAAMALAMIAAGAAGAETSTGRTTGHLKRESSLLERRTARLHTFSSFQKPLEGHNSNKSVHVPKDKAAAKAAALAAARDIERTAKIGSGRGLSAIAMATSSQRRSTGDMERVRRWNNSEAMGAAWTECLQSADTKSGFGNDYCALSYKFVAVLVTSFALARNMQRAEIDRHAQANVLIRHRICTGIRMWRKLIHCLEEMDCLFGACGEQLSSEHVFWKLDFMESSSRMRQCLKRNYKGSYHEGAAANYIDDITPGNVLHNVMSSPNNSILTAEAISVDSMNEEDDQIEYGNSEWRSPDKYPLINNNSVLSKLEKPPSSSDGLGNSLLSNDHDPNLAPSVVSPRHVPIEVDERIIIELSSSMIRLLRVVHGTFQVTTKRINFLVVESEQNSMTDQHSAPKHHEKNRSWLISSVHQIYSRRFLLRRSGLELFMVGRSNFFFDFGSVEARRNAYKAIVQAHPPHLNNIYLATQKPELLLKRTQLMERWVRWEISNFEYLMQLNTLAGRSYNDITQYPVFPWILSDYTSKSLNLEDPSAFRDLSKPVGALDVERLQKFQERYSSFDDPVIPKFHYGSHYSTAGTVLYYLVRVEPFSTLAIQLQGGKFDHADRMFSDIGATWKGVLEDMSDVKELVPELFYLPEILTNENSIDFGTTQLGETLDFVSLPPWAENPVDFIHKHRMALESEHVSSHLNEWIDLIFGYKQRGKEAQLANNVFFYITYEGAVNIDKIHDPVLQRATQDQIAYFGQTPSQLLTTPHLKKLPLSEVLHLQTIFRNPKAVKSYVVPSPELCNLPAAVIHASSDIIVVADTNVPAARVVKHNWQPNTPDGHGMPFLFQHGKPASSSGGGTFMRMFKGSTSSPVESRFPQAVAFPCSGIRSTSIVCVTSDKEIITGGHADNSIRLLSSDDAKTIEVAVGHCAPVTCLAISPDSSYLITGSRDTTLILWKLHVLTSSSFTGGAVSAEPPTVSVTPTSTSGNTIMNISVDKSHRPRVEGPVHILRGHISEITCCCVDSDLGIVASSSESSGVLLHSIKKGCLIRKLSRVKAHSICLSSEGVILTWNKEVNRLDAFTLNGIRISTMKIPSYGIVGCMEISSDGRYASVGFNRSLQNVHEKFKKVDSVEEYTIETQTTDIMDIHVPSICFLDLYKLEVAHVIELGEEQDITTFALNKDNTNLLVSTADKQFMIVTDPTLSLKVVNQMLKLGWEGDGLSPLIR